MVPVFISAGLPQSALAIEQLAALRSALAAGVGSHPAWRMPTPLSVCSRDSHQVGGRVFLIFVADPKTGQ
ncbi:MAG: hypothetical protein QOH34_1285 [Mycobacterium sp.]|nr:hypothetical protein [Mycobacterium sp.]